jgi:hypothetical protein
MTIAFGLSTQERKDLLLETLNLVWKYAPEDSPICICDDASSDGTPDAIEKWIETTEGAKGRVSLVTHQTIRGVAQTKSDILTMLMSQPEVTDVILLEDDCQPTMCGWYESFLRTAHEHHQAHLLYLPTNFKYGNIMRTDEGENPVAWKTHCSGLLMYFRAELLAQVGFFENRFGRYGYDHNEFTSRCLLAQWHHPTALYPHCVAAERDYALISLDMIAEANKHFFPSSTLDENGSNRAKILLARANKPLYDFLIGQYISTYQDTRLANKTPEEKLAQRSTFFQRK